jgi:hypothetical protein
VGAGPGHGCLEQAPTKVERVLSNICPLDHQNVERHEAGCSLSGESTNLVSASSRPTLQCPEVEPPVSPDTSSRRGRAQGEVARLRPGLPPGT